MRDPLAVTTVEADQVRRRLAKPLDKASFLRTELAQKWVDAGDLTPYAFESDVELLSPRIPFVSYPFEWSDSQLHAAAALTLRLHAQAVDVGYGLKDASAWNVIHRGTVPVFCDLMSFEPLAQRQWWAAGQFGRHFLLPLLLARRRGWSAGQTFLVWRDGLPPEQARRLLGPAWWFGRWWPLMMRGQSLAAGLDGRAARADAGGDHARHHHNLLAGLAWMLKGLDPARRPATGQRSFWSGYTTERDHYVSDSLARKRAAVAGWLSTLSPARTLDLGANDGEFSDMAAAAGSEVIAVDADHDAIDHMYRRLGRQDRITPVMAALDDLGGGRGWRGTEFPGLAERLRGRCDLVMMLALIHHLTIAAGVRLADVVAFTSGLAARHLIVEWIGPEDPQFQILCQHRQRPAEDWSIQLQRAAFEEGGWVLRAQLDLHPAHRSLALLERT